MIKVFNKGKTIVYIGSVCLRPLQEIIVEDHEEEKINKAFSLAKLGLVRTTIIEQEPEVKTVSIIEEIPQEETKSSKPKTKRKSNKIAD